MNEGIIKYINTILFPSNEKIQLDRGWLVCRSCTGIQYWGLSIAPEQWTHSIQFLSSSSSVWCRDRKTHAKIPMACPRTPNIQKSLGKEQLGDSDPLTYDGAASQRSMVRWKCTSDTWPTDAIVPQLTAQGQGFILGTVRQKERCTNSLPSITRVCMCRLTKINSEKLRVSL